MLVDKTYSNKQFIMPRVSSESVGIIKSPARKAIEVSFQIFKSRRHYSLVTIPTRRFNSLDNWGYFGSSAIHSHKS
jgi:hypothetical protein